MVTKTSTRLVAATLAGWGLAVGPAVAQSMAQSAPDRPVQDGAANGGAGVRAGHITATGETVPNPGASQGAGTTQMDRGIERENDRIQSSICKGC